MIGWDDNDKVFVIKNSWGNIPNCPFGKFKVSYNDIEHFFGFRIIYDKTDLPVSTAEYLFKDLTSDSWAFESVKQLKELGIITGYED